MATFFFIWYSLLTLYVHLPNRSAECQSPPVWFILFLSYPLFCFAASLVSLARELSSCALRFAISGTLAAAFGWVLPNYF